MTQPNVAAKLIAALCLLGLSNASAAVITFNVIGGTLDDGSTFSGTVTIDNTAGAITATNINIGGPDAPDTCSGLPYEQYADAGLGYVLGLNCSPGFGPLVLVLASDPLGDLLGYTGGPIVDVDGYSFLGGEDDGDIEVIGGALAPTTGLDTAFQVGYAANINLGESNIDITNTGGAGGVSALGPGFDPGTDGDICVNVYAIDPGEELISCCSCLITPDATANLGVIRDLTSNTLTGASVTSVTVNLFATVPNLTALGAPTCDNSAAGLTGAGIVNGMAAFGTTLHATPTAGRYAITEKPFIPATLGADELASLQGRCASIIGNASGFGVCASCRAGALGAAKLAQ